MNDEILTGIDNTIRYNVPTECTECSGPLEYKGVGEYRCTKCGHILYDDYGKVRNYLEKHHGANQVEVSNATGVSKAIIKQMIHDGRLQVR